MKPNPKTHGGPRKGAGRPKSAGVRVFVTLPEKTVAMMDDQRGRSYSRSEWIRMALDTPNGMASDL